MKNSFMKRFLYSILGVFLISLAVSIFRTANIGTDPFSCFNLGISNLTGLSFGSAQLSTNIVLTVLLIVPGLKFFGIGTVTSMVLVGYVSDFILNISPFDVTGASLLVKVVLVCIGVMVTSTGIAMYSCANLGISQYDAMGFIIADKSKGRIKLAYARIAVDITLLVCGYLMGSVVGVGTVIIALAVGPTVSWLIKKPIGRLVKGTEQ